MDYLSIHDLTRRSTEEHVKLAEALDLSIHDLTRRSTGRCSHRIHQPKSFNSRPHKEVDENKLINESLS